MESKIEQIVNEFISFYESKRDNTKYFKDGIRNIIEETDVKKLEWYKERYEFDDIESIIEALFPESQFSLFLVGEFMSSEFDLYYYGMAWIENGELKTMGYKVAFFDKK